MLRFLNTLYYYNDNNKTITDCSGKPEAANTLIVNKSLLQPEQSRLIKHSFKSQNKN